MHTIDPTSPVADLASSLPGAARAFEKLGIDYCCRGRQSLEDAAAALDLPLARVLAELEREAIDRDDPPLDLGPAALIEHLLSKHHVFARIELTRLAPLVAKVERVHGDKHPELRRVRELFESLRADLFPHMQKEELVLFPYVLRLANGELRRPPFGKVANPIFVMEREHEQVGEILAELERVTAHYTPPEGACGSYGALYAGLKALQADLHQHVHLENNVLFPAAVELEG